MTNIDKVFKLGDDLIFAISENHPIKVNDILVDNNNLKYKVLGVCYETKDILVRPLSKVQDLKIIKTVN